MKYKKMTKKEVESELGKLGYSANYLHKELTDIKHLTYSVSKVLDSFIKFMGKEKDFMTHLKKENAKEVKNAKEKTDSKHEKLQKKAGDNKQSK